MICSSVYLVRFIVRPFLGSDSNSKWRKNPVAGQWDGLEEFTAVHRFDWSKLRAK